MLNSNQRDASRATSVRRARGAGSVPTSARRAVVVAVGALVGFALLTVVVLGFGVDGWDRAALRAVERLHGHSLTKAVKTVTALGSLDLVAPLTVVMVIAAMLLRRPRAAALVVLAVVGADLLQLALKPLFGRPRPHVFPRLEQVGSAAYPSGHAIVSAALAFALVAICWRRPWRTAAASAATVYTVAVGFSRVYLGVHYPSDVLGAWLLATAWVAVLCAALRPVLLLGARRAADGEAEDGPAT
jgi:membrane-associated phospholipid phosphatase